MLEQALASQSEQDEQAVSLHDTSETCQVWATITEQTVLAYSPESM